MGPKNLRDYRIKTILCQHLSSNATTNNLVRPDLFTIVRIVLQLIENVIGHPKSGPHAFTDHYYKSPELALEFKK